MLFGGTKRTFVRLIRQSEFQNSFNVDLKLINSQIYSRKPI